MAEEIEVKKIATRSLYALAQLYFSSGIDLRYELEINKKCEDPVYFPSIAQSLLKV